MADDKLTVEIDFDEKRAKKSMKRIEKNTKDSLNRISNTAATVGAVLASALVTRKFISAAIVQENAVNKLNTALKVTGQFTKETSEELQRFASEMQTTTVFGDEAILSQMGLAMAMGATADQSKTILDAATNLSAAFNMDLNAAVRNVSKTLGGYAGELGEILPQLKNFTKEQMMAGDAADFIANKYAGFAAGEAKTFGGALQQLGIAWGDVFERIGEIITQSPILIKAMNTATKVISNLLKKTDISKLTESVSGFVFLAVDLGVVLAGLAQPLVTVWRVADVVFQNIRTLVQTAIAVIVRNLSVIADLPFMDNLLPTEALKNLRASTKETFDGMIVDRNEAWDRLKEGNTEFSDNLKTVAENFQTSMISMVETTKNTLDASTDAGGETVKKMIDLTKEFRGAIKNSIGQAAADAFTRFGKALVTGKNAFSGFFQSMMGMLGDLAIQLGKTTLLAGIAMDSLFKFNTPGAAIAAGLALMAFGGILKGLSGGKGGAADTAVGTGGEAGGTTIDQNLLAEDSGETREETGPRVTLNVQGDVLDSDETGTRLVSILNEAFENKGETLITA